MTERETMRAYEALKLIAAAGIKVKNAGDSGRTAWALGLKPWKDNPEKRSHWNVFKDDVLAYIQTHKKQEPDTPIQSSFLPALDSHDAVVCAVHRLADTIAAASERQETMLRKLLDVWEPGTKTTDSNWPHSVTHQ